MGEESDWRLETGEEPWMYGARLQWIRFRPLTDDWDHEHCALCWATFVDADDGGHLQEGYVFQPAPHPSTFASEEERTTYVERGRIVAAPSEDVWICAGCFADFEERFGWTAEEA